MKNYYNILNISKDAEYRDVIKAYNNFINYFNKKTLNDDDKLLIKEIKEAYFVLGSYHNRRNYDNKMEGYKKIENFSDRSFFRPDLDYKHNTDLKIRSIDSDLQNNRKVRNNDINNKKLESLDNFRL